ncbi:MAG: endonuclease/exonuclease/phosphatase family protein [Desulfuromonadales bacterium]|nr:endonuclease/exonuclease/phosphatase family protein [Desulfuromonadales bacterium]
MPGLRIMTYNVRAFSHHRDGLAAIEGVIAASAPDIVALQEVDSAGNELQILSQRLGMRLYVAPGRCGNAFLSYYPLHHLQSFSLSDHGCCLRAELDFGQKRMHFYNVQIDGAQQHKEQIDSLLGDDLLGAQHLGIPSLILGDFGYNRRVAINWDLILALQRVTRPLVHGTYPAWLPLLARDRAYILGELRVLAIEVVRTRLARQASSHLPLLLTVEITDLRKFLKIPPSFAARNLEIATG